MLARDIFGRDPNPIPRWFDEGLLMGAESEGVADSLGSAHDSEACDRHRRKADGDG